MNAYEFLVNNTVTHGLEVESRFGLTREMIGFRFAVDVGMNVHRRGLNRHIGWMEVMQLLAGIYDHAAFAAVAPNANLDLFTGPMAYGPRLGDQLTTAVGELRRNPNSRQVVIYIGRPADGMTNDQPCTTTVQLLLREGSVYGVVSMRSWDLLKGLPYDIMMFSAIVYAAAAMLKMLPGDLVISAASAHVYEGDLAAMQPRPQLTQWAFEPDVLDWFSSQERIKDWAMNSIARAVRGEWQRKRLPDGITTREVNTPVGYTFAPGIEAGEEVRYYTGDHNGTIHDLESAPRIDADQGSPNTTE